MHARCTRCERDVPVTTRLGKVVCYVCGLVLFRVGK